MFGLYHLLAIFNFLHFDVFIVSNDNSKIFLHIFSNIEIISNSDDVIIYVIDSFTIEGT